MIALVIVVPNEGGDLCFKVTGQEVVLQQDAVLEGLMPTLDLALGLRMIRCATCVRHAFVFQIYRQFTGDVARTIVHCPAVDTKYQREGDSRRGR